MALKVKLLVGAGALLAAGITVSAGWYAFGGIGAEAQKVRMSKVADGAIVETVSAPGVVEPETKVDISAETSARIMELPFEEGAEVKKGDVVVRLDDRDLRARHDAVAARASGDQARLEGELARLEGPRTTLANARQTLERQRKLYETGDVSRQALDDAEARVRDLEASLAASEKNIGALRNALTASQADIARSEQELRRATIISPLNGRLVRLNAEVGELVMVGTMNNAGTVILTVADLTHMNVVAQVAEADIARVRVGQPVEVHVNAYKGRIFKGEVTEVALQRTKAATGGGNSLDAGTFEVEIRLAVDGEQILSGLAANVEVEVGRANGLVVPAQAIVDRKLTELPESLATSPHIDTARRAASVIFKVVDGKAVATVVKVGAGSLTESIVLNGLAAGDTVVTGPYKVLEKLKDGDPVIEDQSAHDDEAKPESGGMKVRMGGSGRRGH